MRNKEKADRAKLFLPFDALKGFQEALREKEKIIVPKKTLSEEEAESLSRKIQQIKKGNIIKVIYFDKDNYLALEGMVAKVDFSSKFVTIVKTKIAFEDLLDVSGESIKDFSYDDELMTNDLV